jgi:hypothetical protein
MPELRPGEHAPKNARCYGCGRNENITFRGRDMDRRVFYLCEDCNEETRIMMVDLRAEFGMAEPVNVPVIPAPPKESTR